MISNMKKLIASLVLILSVISISFAQKSESASSSEKRTGKAMEENMNDPSATVPPSNNFPQVYPTDVNEKTLKEEKKKHSVPVSKHHRKFESKRIK
jgi:hypothetical protein